VVKKVKARKVAKVIYEWLKDKYVCEYWTGGWVRIHHGGRKLWVQMDTDKIDVLGAYMGDNSDVWGSVAYSDPNLFSKVSDLIEPF